MNNRKLAIFFRRVSTAGQDLSTQEEFDRPYREQLVEEEMVIINENATSANKLSIHGRPKIQKALSLIKDNKVHTLYAYDRTRLFRDYFEAMEFNDLCKKHNVDIIYTSNSNGHLPSSNNTLIEGMLNIFGDIEGKNIARRTQEANRKYPVRKLGYLKENKAYKKDKKKEAVLISFFGELKSVTSLEDINRLMALYRKKMHVDDIRLFQLAKDPFYAGYDLQHGSNQLPHVEAYLTFKEYQEIQTQAIPYLKKYVEQIDRLRTKGNHILTCGCCEKQMQFRLNQERTNAFYTCSRGHHKIEYDVQEMEKIIHFVVTKLIGNLNSNKLVAHSKKQLYLIKSEINKELHKVEQQIEQLTTDLLLTKGEYVFDWSKEPNYVKLQTQKQKYDSLTKKLDEKNEQLIENKQIHELVKGYLENQVEANLDTLEELFIQDIKVYPNSLEFCINKFDYLSNLDKEMFFCEGEQLCN